ncbi:MAG: hypothetical protein ACRC8Y_08185 [Chroococcales cyanobacterium]
MRAVPYGHEKGYTILPLYQSLLFIYDEKSFLLFLRAKINSGRYPRSHVITQAGISTLAETLLRSSSGAIASTAKTKFILKFINFSFGSSPHLTSEGLYE